MRKDGQNMKRYLVMAVLTPTAENVKKWPDNAGQVHVYFYGVKNYKLFAHGCSWINFDLMNAYQIKEHGYKRECDARRSFEYTHPQNDEGWRTVVQIIECEV